MQAGVSMNLSDESTLVDLMNACASMKYPDQGASPIHPILSLQIAVGDLTKILRDAWTRQAITSLGISHFMTADECMRAGCCIGRILSSTTQVAFELGLTLWDCLNSGRDVV